MDFEEEIDLAEIDLTYSPIRGISRARPALGTSILRIIQVVENPCDLPAPDSAKLPRLDSLVGGLLALVSGGDAEVESTSS